MELRKNNYSRMFGKGEILPFEEKVLSSGLCDFVLPANFIKEKDKKWIVYDCSGYTSLSEIKFSGFDEVLEVLEKSLNNLRKVSEFLIDPCKVRMNGQTVFHNLKRRDIKFAYMPAESDSMADNIAELIECLQLKVGNEEKRILREMQERMLCRNMSLREMADHVSMKRRELAGLQG